ncbi:hypothetical protein Tco_0995005 [Tanacetum coccineum]
MTGKIICWKAAIDNICIASMHIYWASVFLIPKTTVKEIEKALEVFLWSQGDLKKGAAKVAWKVNCAPKSQGGLGIKILGPWNEALLCKHLWNVSSIKESFWVKRVNVVKLKGNSIWEVDIDDNDSGTWKALLNLRSKIRESVWKKIGDGKNTNVWFDKWCNESPLCDIVPFRYIYEARLSERSSILCRLYHEWKNVVADIANGGCKNNINSIMERIAISTVIYYI